MRAQRRKLYHLGIRNTVSRNTRVGLCADDEEPASPVVPHPLGDRLALLLRHRTLPLRDRLARLLPGASGDRRRIPFYRLYGTLNGNEPAPERLLLIP